MDYVSGGVEKPQAGCTYATDGVEISNASSLRFSLVARRSQRARVQLLLHIIRSNISGGGDLSSVALCHMRRQDSTGACSLVEIFTRSLDGPRSFQFQSRL